MKKKAINEWEHDGFDILRALHNVYKKLGQFFYPNYLLTCLNIYV